MFGRFGFGRPFFAQGGEYVSTYIETGTAASDLQTSGTDVRASSEVGLVVADLQASAAESISLVDSGHVIADLQASAVSLTATADTGKTVSDLQASGFTEDVYTETGLVISDLQTSGQDVFNQVAFIVRGGKVHFEPVPDQYHIRIEPQTAIDDEEVLEILAMME